MTADKAGHAGRIMQEVGAMGIRCSTHWLPQSVGKLATERGRQGCLPPGKSRVDRGSNGLQVRPIHRASGQEIRQGTRLSSMLFCARFPLVDLAIFLEILLEKDMKIPSILTLSL